MDSAARPGTGDPPAELSSEVIAGLGALLYLLHCLPGTMERKARDEALNAALAAALVPIAKAATELGAFRSDTEILMVDVFAHASGLLLLHTGRIRMFGASAKALMQDDVRHRIKLLPGG